MGEKPFVPVVMLEIDRVKYEHLSKYTTTEVPNGKEWRALCMD